MTKALRDRVPSAPQEAPGAAAGPARGARAFAVASGPGAAPDERRRDDPLAAVLALGEQTVRVGVAIGAFLALTTHGAFVGKAVASAAQRDMRLLIEQMRAEVHDYLWTVYDVDLSPPKPEVEDKPKPPEPAPAPEPEPEPRLAPPPQANTPPKADPYEPPPAAAEATKILTREEDPDEILDMTDRGIASGEGAGVGYGQVAGAGTARTPTFDPNAKVGGVVGGKGTGDPAPPPPAAPAPNRSKPPGLVGGSSWRCPFPPEADVDQVDRARAVIMVTVRPDGTPLSVKVVSDPGHGFGRAARICALSRRFTPGLDKSGAPTTSTTPPITVNFTR